MTRCSDRAIGVAGSPRRDQRPWLTAIRIVALEAVAGRGVDPLAADEHLILDEAGNGTHSLAVRTRHEERRPGVPVDRARDVARADVMCFERWWSIPDTIEGLSRRVLRLPNIMPQHTIRP